MKNNNRVAVFIDGSNLYHKLKDLKIAHTSNFDYIGLCKKLSGTKKLISSRYYVGAIRVQDNNKKSQILRVSQLKLFNKLASQGFVIKKGSFLFNSQVFHEKGVDVKLAVDLLVGAYEDIWDIAIIISSDSDLEPAIKQVKYLGKKVEYIGFSHNSSHALKKVSSSFKLLDLNYIKEFIFKNIKNR